MDAVPFLVERKGAGVKPVKDFALLQEMRRFLQWRSRDAILLAEANVPPDESMNYFGDEGDRLPMIQYGDEIGMGEDLSLNEREATRTPMQWTDEPHGGFTCAEKPVLPVIDK